ncbi:hypothetical protein R0131_07910 [Clostridium sp. AL.422]|uniref:hypothetical protein n=1 Tax=Clostridium TaxID=1485 RepID=UPI00293DBC23|nr:MULTISPECIES: hypothetical protein [unclassified Clostridium]MDV4150761.1 hypothetical protein [Clostridium sp. AL.422]
MKGLKIMRAVCIDLVVVLLVTIIVSIVLEKPAIVYIIEGVLCVLSFIGAYILNKIITKKPPNI